MDIFDSLLGAAMAGGSSWEDIPDKPFGEKETVWGIIAPPTETALDEEGEGMLRFSETEDVPIVVGEEYIVTFNGTDYLCVAESNTRFLYRIKDPNNEAPFYLKKNKGSVTVGGIEIVAETYANQSVTVSIKGKVEVLSKIPAELLPEGYPYMEKEEGKVATVLAEGRYTSSHTDNYGGAFYIGLPHGLGYVPQKIIVNYEGTVYRDLQVNFINEQLGNLTGNLGLMNSIMGTNFPDTGEPFIVALTASNGILLVPDTAPTEHTVGIWEQGEIVHKMDAKFIPDEANGVYVVKNVMTYEELEQSGSFAMPINDRFEELLPQARAGKFFVFEFVEQGINKRRYSQIESQFQDGGELAYISIALSVRGKDVTFTATNVSD